MWNYFTGSVKISISKLKYRKTKGFQSRELTGCIIRKKTAKATLWAPCHSWASKKDWKLIKKTLFCENLDANIYRSRKKPHFIILPLIFFSFLGPSRFWQRVCYNVAAFDFLLIVLLVKTCKIGYSIFLLVYMNGGLKPLSWTNTLRMTPASWQWTLQGPRIRFIRMINLLNLEIFGRWWAGGQCMVY